MRKASKQFGFTIVELMIATIVFSFVLLLMTGGIIAVGRMYYKGLTTAGTQEVARSVMEDVSRSLQFAGSGARNNDPDGIGPAQPTVWCFGQDRYKFYINEEVNGGNNQGLLYDRLSPGAVCDATGTGEQLLGQNMRLLEFFVSPNNPHTVRLVVAYGDDDILVGEDDGTPADALCEPNRVGGNFCAVSGLETLVTRRV